MKIKFIFLLTIIPLIIHGQEQCASDIYFNYLKEKHPSLNSEVKKIVKNITNQRELGKSTSNNQIINIPLVFNVIHNGESIGNGRNISESKILEQINILNNAYSGVYGGVDTRIRFCLAQENFSGTRQQGIFRFLGNENYQPYKLDEVFNTFPQWDESVDQSIKLNRNTAYPTNLYLNVWVLDLIDENGNDSLLGYSSFPYYVEGLIEASNGVVVDYEFFGINNQTQSEGKNLVHEIGHWLGLFHTFSSNCDEVSCVTEGDMICDTPAMPTQGYTNVASGICKGYDCNNNITSVVKNYMDYQNPNRFFCRDTFTQGQADRMRDILMTYKGSIYSNTNTICGSYSNNSGGGGHQDDGYEECRSLDIQVERAFKITHNDYSVESSFGWGSEVDDNTLAISDPTNNKIYLYDLESDCNINSNPKILEKNRSDVFDFKFGEYFTMDEDRLFVRTTEIFENTNADINNYHSEIIFYEKNQNGNWTEKQIIQRPSNYPNSRFFGIEMLSSNDELLVSNGRSIFVYRFFENQYQFMHSIDIAPAYQFTYDATKIFGLQYNGKYLAFSNGDQGLYKNLTIELYKKEINGQFIKRNFDSENEIKANIFIISDDPDNKLYAYYRNNNLHTGAKNRIQKYDLNSFTSTSNNINLLESINIDSWAEGHEKAFELFLNSNYLIFNFNNPQRVEIYDILDDFNRVIPNDADGLNSTTIYPATDRGTRSLDVGGNYLTVSTYLCREVFLYKLDNLFGTNAMDRSVFGTPTGDYISGKNISVGGAYDAIFSETTQEKTFQAESSITFKPGTHIQNGANVTAIIGGFCILNGGIVVEDHENTSSKIVHNKSYDTFDDISDTISLSEDDVLAVYPNPTQNSITISPLNGKIILETEIYSFSGQRLVYDSKERFDPFNIELSELPTGTYFLRCRLNSYEIIEKKIIKR